MNWIIRTLLVIGNFCLALFFFIVGVSVNYQAGNYGWIAYDILMGLLAASLAYFFAFKFK